MRIVAEGIDGASEHFHELARESKKIDETHIHIGPVDIVIEDPIQAVNCFIRHNPAEVLRFASEGLKDFMVSGEWPGRTEAIWQCSGQRHVDCDICLEQSEAAEFLLYEYARAAFIQQWIAKVQDRPVGHLRMHIQNATVHKENFDQFFWCVEERWDLGLANAPLNLIQQTPDVFQMELILALSEKRGMGIRTPFIRKLLLPMLHILDHLEHKNIDGVCFQVNSLPDNLDWAEAQRQWTREVFKENENARPHTKN